MITDDAFLNLNARLIQVFIAVYEHQSVGEAAITLDLNQSTVSHHLETLRSILGDSLFVKKGRNIVPTELANAKYPDFKNAFHSLQAVCASASFDPDSDRRTITIAGNIDGFADIVISIYQELGRTAPHLPVRFIELGTQNRLDEVLERDSVDVILCGKIQNYPRNAMYHTIKSDPLLCFYDPEMREPVDSISKYESARHALVDFVDLGESTVESQLVGIGIRRNIVLNAPNFTLLAEMVRGTDLIMTMRSSYKDSYLSGFATCNCPVDLPPLRLDLVWHRRNDTAPRSKWIRDRILASAGRL